MGDVTVDVTARLTSMRSSTAALIAGIEDGRWSDADVGAPSSLPDWTRGHVVTHLARNADAIAGALAAALRDEQIEMYPDGRAARDAAIDAGANRPAAEQLADLRSAAERLDRVFGAVADGAAWDRRTAQRVVRDLPAVRWREVEIHRVDLGTGYGADDWPAEFVAYLLPEVATDLADRSRAPTHVTITADGSVVPELVGSTWGSGDDHAAEVAGPDWAVLAWLLGRPSDSLPSAPELEPWR